MRVKKNKNKFQQFCIDRNLTAKEVGKLLGLSKHTIHSYFASKRLPSRKTMKRFERVFKIDPNKIFDYEITDENSKGA